MRCLLKCEKRKYTDGRNLERRGVKMWNEEADVECENKYKKKLKTGNKETGPEGSIKMKQD